LKRINKLIIDTKKYIKNIDRGLVLILDKVFPSIYYIYNAYGGNYKINKNFPYISFDDDIYKKAGIRTINDTLYKIKMIKRWQNREISQQRLLFLIKEKEEEFIKALSYLPENDVLFTRYENEIEYNLKRNLNYYEHHEKRKEFSENLIDEVNNKPLKIEEIAGIKYKYKQFERESKTLEDLFTQSNVTEYETCTYTADYNSIEYIILYIIPINKTTIKLVVNFNSKYTITKISNNIYKLFYENDLIEKDYNFMFDFFMVIGRLKCIHLIKVEDYYYIFFDDGNIKKDECFVKSEILALYSYYLENEEAYNEYLTSKKIKENITSIHTLCVKE
jgi:hypothetical protein